MWYLTCFQNLRDGERFSAPNPESSLPFSSSPPSSSSPLPLHLLQPTLLLLWLFHQHSTPYFFRRWSTDGGKSASWSGPTSSISTSSTLMKMTPRLLSRHYYHILMCNSLQPYSNRHHYYHILMSTSLQPYSNRQHYYHILMSTSLQPYSICTITNIYSFLLHTNHILIRTISTTY